MAGAAGGDAAGGLRWEPVPGRVSLGVLGATEATGGRGEMAADDADDAEAEAGGAGESVGAGGTG